MAARRGRPKKSAGEIKEQVTMAVKEVKDSAEPIVKDIQDKAESVLKDAKENAESAVKKVKQTAEATVEAVSNDTKPVGEAVKETAQKVTETAKRRGKAAGEKLASKVKTVDIGNFFEISGEQIKVEDVVKRIQEAYKADGHRIGAIKSMQVYYNFEERKAYYVINGKAEDKFVTF